MNLLEIRVMLLAEILPIKFRLLPVVVAIILVVIALPRLIRLLRRIKEIIISEGTQEIYQKVVEPDQDLLPSISFLLIADVILLITGHLVPQIDFIDIIEFPIGLSAALVIGWLGYELFERYFKIYITQLTLSEKKLNEDLLIAAKWLAFLLFSFIIITIFAQTHEINILGLIASLGVGGIAIAFAAQKTLEQLLGGIVLYLDRPFVVDDYVGLPDGTFGKVESIGLRSTKIRTSGKGTLMVVPNSYLTGINIENFTGASKVINVTKINFSEHISETKKAFIRQLILEDV
jgi:MscS family membrane protein